MKWQNKLSKSELRHLREVGVTSLRALKENAEHQIKVRAECGIEPCYECKHINIKLGLPVQPSTKAS